MLDDLEMEIERNKIGQTAKRLKNLCFKDTPYVDTYEDADNLKRAEKRLKELEDKFDSLSEQDRQDLFGGEFGVWYEGDNEDIVDMEYGEPIPLYLTLDIASIMLTKHYILNSHMNDEFKEKAKKLRTEISKLRDKFAALKYDELFDSNKHFNRDVALEIADSNNYKFDIENEYGEPFITVDVTGHSNRSLEPGDYGYDETGYSYDGTDHLPFKTVTYDTGGLAFKEDAEIVHEKANEEYDKKMEEFNNSITDEVKSYFPDGVIPPIEEISNLEYENGVDHHIVTYLKRIAQNKEIVNSNTRLDSEIENARDEIKTDIRLLHSRERELVEAAEKEIVDRKNAIDEAKSRYQAKNPIWGFMHRKLNPAKMDLSDKSTEEINSMLVEKEEIKGDDLDQPTK